MKPIAIRTRTSDFSFRAANHYTTRTSEKKLYTLINIHKGLLCIRMHIYIYMFKHIRGLRVARHGVIVNELGWYTLLFSSDFHLHWVPQTSGLVQKLSYAWLI